MMLRKRLTFIKMINYTAHFTCSISFNPQNSAAIKVPQLVRDMVTLLVQEHTPNARTSENTVFLFSHSLSFRTHLARW